jgi:hypothetical protein
MKNNRIELLKWLPSEGEYIEIDWPKVHKTIGVDHTNWLLKQPLEKCQLVLERTDMYCRLVAEFYDSQILTNYYLLWAK